MQVKLEADELEHILTLEDPNTIKRILLEKGGMEVPQTYREHSQNLEEVVKTHSSQNESTAITLAQNANNSTSKLGKYAKLVVGDVLKLAYNTSLFIGKCIVNAVGHTVILPLLPEAVLKNYESVSKKGGLRFYNNVLSAIVDVGVASSLAWYATDKFDLNTGWSIVLSMGAGVIGLVATGVARSYRYDPMYKYEFNTLEYVKDVNGCRILLNPGCNKGCIGPLVIEKPTRLAIYAGKKTKEHISNYIGTVKARVETMGTEQETTGIRVESIQDPEYEPAEVPTSNPNQSVV